ncbi:hypothetical protein Hypma_002480 [Hypsizygus marmoreus]|uniref:Uncharacterized protein n=1 Tax=Hypsizygus marmoreus TaxID=39966 RepID=A0A369J8B0_HYPMA|nr:hypothetical protein Hypma_002480 [Hypsizygus marmoreus]
MHLVFLKPSLATIMLFNHAQALILGLLSIAHQTHAAPGRSTEQVIPCGTDGAVLGLNINAADKLVARSAGYPWGTKRACFSETTTTRACPHYVTRVNEYHKEQEKDAQSLQIPDIQSRRNLFPSRHSIALIHAHIARARPCRFPVLMEASCQVAHDLEHLYRQHPSHHRARRTLIQVPIIALIPTYVVFPHISTPSPTLRDVI